MNIYMPTALQLSSMATNANKRIKPVEEITLTKLKKSPNNIPGKTTSLIYVIAVGVFKSLQTTVQALTYK